jgi:hypothetical protein
LKNPRQLVVLGDSYINWVSHTFPQDLVAAYGAPAKGVWDVPNNQGGRLYAIGAWAMGSGGIGLIPDQFVTAVKEDPNIIAAVITGGGNDILVPDAKWMGGGDCKNSSALPPTKVCQDIITTAFDAARKLMHDSADKGVKDVIYFFYPDVPAGTVIGGTSPATILDWAYPQVQKLCDDTEMETGGKLRCHFLDTRPLFKGHPEYFAPTDIHENSMGSKAITQAIVQIMKDQCIAQPESSGCCEP